MNAPAEPKARSASTSSLTRRVAVSVIAGGLIFLVLWIMAFSVFTSMLIGSGCCVVLVATSEFSDLVEMVLDAIASVIFGVLAVIAAVFGAIFSLFGF